MGNPKFDNRNPNNVKFTLGWLIKNINLILKKIANIESTPSAGTLDQTLANGNTSNRDINLGGYQAPASFSSFVSGLFGIFSRTTVNPGNIVFQNNISKTTLVAENTVSEETEVTLTLPFKTGRLALEVPYRVYTDLIAQEGVAAPTGVNLENTTGGTVTYSYVGPGEYVGTCVDFTIPEGKFVPVPFISAMDDLVISMERLTDTTFRIFVTGFTRVGTDELVYGLQPLSFKIYN